MSKFFNPELLKQIEKHEGTRKKIYYDSMGVPTIGVGHNLNDPFSQEVIDYIFIIDLQEVIIDIRAKQSWILYHHLSQARRNAFIGMVFNLGITKFGKFKKMIKAAKEKDWQEAHDQALDSLWAKQVKGRAKTLALQILNG